ncbi:MAG: HAD family hydrolase, partial [Solirubrobacteraceae bacterium]
AVSNWDVSLLEVLELAGLGVLLDAVVSSAAVGAAKPAPAIFGHALALSGARPEHALHVGDSLAEDVAGARACGIEAVLLDRSGAQRPSGVTTIASLAELTLSPSGGEATRGSVLEP